MVSGVVRGSEKLRIIGKSGQNTSVSVWSPWMWSFVMSSAWSRTCSNKVLQWWCIFVGQCLFPRQKPNRIFPLNFGLMQTSRSFWLLHILLIMIVFTNKHNFYQFWSLNKITRSKTLNVGYKQTTCGHMTMTALKKKKKNSQKVGHLLAIAFFKTSKSFRNSQGVLWMYFMWWNKTWKYLVPALTIDHSYLKNLNTFKNYWLLDDGTETAKMLTHLQKMHHPCSTLLAQTIIIITIAPEAYAECTWSVPIRDFWPRNVVVEQGI